MLVNNMTQLYMKAWRITFYSLAVLPLIFIVSLLALYFQTAYTVGYLPYFNHPEQYNTWGGNFLSPIVLGSFVMSLYSFCLWVILLLIHFFNKNKEQAFKAKIVSAVTYLSAYGLMFSDAFSWYLD